MAHVILRFFGRFMYATSNKTGQIKVIAPRFDPDVHGEHLPLMTIRRDQLKFQEQSGGPVLTTLAPTFKIVSDAEPKNAELWVWNLAGLRISYDVSAEVTLSASDGELLAYPEIESLAKNPPPVLHPGATKPAVSQSAMSIAVIDVTGGVGNAQRIDETTLPYLFTKNKDVGTPNHVKDAGGKDVAKTLADIVEFDVTLAAARKTMTMTFRQPDSSVGTVTVIDGTQVGFSHVCSRIALPTELPDLEFMRYYHLLIDPPPSAEQVVPLEQAGSHLVEGPDCTVKVAMSFDE